MSDSRRNYEKICTNTGNRNSQDKNERYRKRSNSTISNDHFISQRTSSIDTKVYVGNVPTDQLTDRELLDFFRPFGKISDIRVYKDYLFVQYERIEDARKLIKQGQTSLILQGNKLDILPAMEVSSTTTKSSSKDRRSSERESSRNSRQHADHERHLSNYEPQRKRFPSKHHTDGHDRRRKNFSSNDENNYGDDNAMEINDNLDRRVTISSSRTCSHRLSRSPNNHPINSSSYTVLIEPDDPKQLVDCQIILVNPRQRSYGEKISSHLRSHGLMTSVILLREDYTLIEATENATREQCLYGIIIMPMHEERHTASFHILHGQTEEHRNLTLEDGYHIILTNFSLYKEHLRNEELNKNNERIIHSSVTQTREDQSSPTTKPIITLGEKLPLSMLLCLLADGRQLSLDEIDRILVYLLEKKAKMLTLPEGTLPPLPVQYATAKIDQKSNSSTIDLSSSSSSELTSTIAEQIRHIISTNLLKSSSLNTNEQNPIHHSSTNNSRNEEKTNHSREERKDFNHFQSSTDQINSEEKKNHQSTFSYSQSNSNSVAVVAPSFHYSSSSTINGNSSNSFVTPNFPSYDSMSKLPTSHSSLNESTSLATPNFSSQSSHYFYPPPPLALTNPNLYQKLPNSAAADTAAAIFQAYSQFNNRPASIPSLLGQQNNTQQQQQLRK